ncbi:biopolymer transporter ExbD [soil metagenome]
MKIVSPLPRKKARIEIIPLIDIMFFLLASFMLVSLTMTKQQTVSVNLPAAATAQADLKPDTISLAVSAAGQVFIEKDPIELTALENLLNERLAANPDLPVYISGDTATPHGAMVAVLDYVRRCGVNKVAFTVRPPDVPQ